MAYRNYKDLTVWQKAMDLTEEVYRLVKILSELETQLLICVRLKYFSESDIETSLSLSNEIDKMLTTLILKLKT